MTTLATRRVKARATASIRVAVYTRKSVASADDAALSSLQAQRDSVERYVESQAGVGWQALPERYDDDGWSGSNTDRPAFKRLLADVEAGRIDVVAVYRMDRLSRRQLDFLRLQEFFETRGVSFVSVTEQFSTSTPTGRLALSLLGTFAQFEREVIAERTRDKMLAARRRGHWTGGQQVLGYDVVEKRLVVNEDEAEQVRCVFELYLGLGSFGRVLDELDRRGWTKKRWVNQRGRESGGKPFSKQSLGKLLTNPLYLGRIQAGDEVVDAEHEAIVDEATWTAVAEQLERNRREPNRARAKHEALLQGLARCSCGAALGYVTTRKGGREYAYYACQAVQKRGASACPGSRVAAHELEAAVVEQVGEVCRDADLAEDVRAAAREEAENRRGEVRRLENRARGLKRKRDRLVDQLADAGPEGAAIRDRLADIEPEYQEAMERIEALRTACHVELDDERLRSALRDWDPVWAALDKRERRRLLGLLLASVTYDGTAGEIEIAFHAEALPG